jgi:hypothetical protein
MRVPLAAPALATLLLGASAPLPAAETEPYAFVVLGHLRGQENGRLNPLLDELVAEAAATEPELAFVTGDSIWGYVRELPDPAAVARQDWEALDAKLDRIGAPVHRVPGNHDISCPDTRDVYFERYEKLPRAFTHRGSRFILLNTTFVPEGDEPSRRYVLTRRLDAEQVGFLRAELADVSAYDHVFVFMHHVLWWFEDAPWWEDVHPLLAAAGVRAVFSGDYGPLKFSHVERDGVDYVRTAIEDKYSVDRGDHAIDALRSSEEDRTLAGQFDNWVHVTVDGADVAIDVRNVGALSSGKFSPDRYRAVYGELAPREGLVYDPARPDAGRLERGWGQRLRGWIGGPRRAAVSVALLAGAFVVGVVLGRRRTGGVR